MEQNDKPPELKPCPFCGQPLNVRWRKMNPKANCATPGCWGGKLPVLQLDIPEFVEAWNTRPNATSHRGAACGASGGLPG